MFDARKPEMKLQLLILGLWSYSYISMCLV